MRFYHSKNTNYTILLLLLVGILMWPSIPPLFPKFMGPIISIYSVSWIYIIHATRIDYYRVCKWFLLNSGLGPDFRHTPVGRDNLTLLLFACPVVGPYVPYNNVVLCILLYYCRILLSPVHIRMYVYHILGWLVFIVSLVVRATRYTAYAAASSTPPPRV